MCFKTFFFMFLALTNNTNPPQFLFYFFYYFSFVHAKIGFFFFFFVCLIVISNLWFKQKGSCLLGCTAIVALKVAKLGFLLQLKKSYKGLHFVLILRDSLILIAAKSRHVGSLALKVFNSTLCVRLIF